MNILINDFSLEEMPHGGSEVGNQVLIDNMNLGFAKSADIKRLSHDDFYIISNISLMNPSLVSQIKDYNYIIFECDYKICHSRHPWRYPGNIIPHSDRINYDLYKNAKAVFVKTQDHLNVYKLNDVEGNFINLKTNIWSYEDLDLLEALHNTNIDKNELHCIYKTNNWIKNTVGSIKYCESNNLSYGFIKNTNNRVSFLSNMAKFHRLVFLPLARETYCRLVVEAKCLGLGVLTTKNYGAVLEDHFKLRGIELIDHLRESNKHNIKLIESFLPG